MMCIFASGFRVYVRARVCGWRSTRALTAVSFCRLCLCVRVCVCTCVRVSRCIVQLLHKLSIRATNGPDKLLKVIKNPITDHLPPNVKKIGMSVVVVAVVVVVHLLRRALAPGRGRHNETGECRVRGWVVVLMVSLCVLLAGWTTTDVAV